MRGGDDPVLLDEGAPAKVAPVHNLDGDLVRPLARRHLSTVDYPDGQGSQGTQVGPSWAKNTFSINFV